MAAVNPYQVYKNQSVRLSSPEELTLMLYNGCLRFIRQAKEAVDLKDIPATHESILRAQEILQELSSSLDMRYEISQGWSEIYAYMLHRLVEANIAKDKNILEEVEVLALSFRDTWVEAMQLCGKRAAVSHG